MPFSSVEFGHGDGEGLALAEEVAVGFVQGLDVFFGEAGAAQADFVQAADLVGAVDFAEGGNVVVDAGVAGDEGSIRRR